MKVYYADINEFDESFFEEAFEYIPETKKPDIARFKNERAKKESLLGWYLFSLGAREYGIDVHRIVFSENGKPSLENSPFHFNISHSDGFVCCAFCKSEVGIDVEKPKSCSSSVVRRVLCENEKRVLETAENKDEAFIRFWTIKESFLKQSGEGIAAGLSRLDFSPYINESSFEYCGLNFQTGEINGFLYTLCSKENDFEFAHID